MSLRRSVTFIIAASFLLTTSACSMRQTADPILEMPNTQFVPERALLDIQIPTFDPGIEVEDEEKPAGQESDEEAVTALRRAEANYFPCMLQETLGSSGQWGAIEVVPQHFDAIELTVDGTIVKSDGETLELAVTASDATGRRWLDKTYKIQTNEVQHMNPKKDPYQPLFNAIANDLVEARSELSGEDLAGIRTISELRFARDFAPDSFQGYLEEDDGELRAVRLPARNDPMFELVSEVRGRESMFIAAQSGHFERFCAAMAKPYARWRWFAREGVLEHRKLRRQALLRKGAAVGLAALSVGAAMMGSPAGLAELAVVAGIAGTAAAWSSGNQKQIEADFHKESLNELTRSFYSEVEPILVDVEGRTVKLEGTVEEQYSEWRRLLRELYLAEQQMPQAIHFQILEAKDPVAPADDAVDADVAADVEGPL
jgi:hypothetical protein